MKGRCHTATVLNGCWSQFFASDIKVVSISVILASFQIVPSIGLQNCHLIMIAIRWPTFLRRISSTPLAGSGIVNMPNDQTTAGKGHVPLYGLSVFNKEKFVKRRKSGRNLVNLRTQAGGFNCVESVLLNDNWFYPLHLQFGPRTNVGGQCWIRRSVRVSHYIIRPNSVSNPFSTDIV